MRNFLFILVFLSYTPIKAQQITGLWISADSSRLYEIKAAADNSFEAVIKSSSRKSDSAGFVVIKAIQFNAVKKRYEGIMYAAADNQPCFVKISTVNNQLLLKLQRMFLFDAVLKWNRAATGITAPGK